jgi:hypothetical protein
MRAHCFSTPLGDVWVSSPTSREGLLVDMSDPGARVLELSPDQVHELRAACDRYLREKAPHLVGVRRKVMA